MINKATKLFLIFAVSLPMFLNAKQVQQKIFRFDTPWLGVMLADVSENKLEELDLENGVQVSKVFKDSPADKAGLETGDIIIRFDEKKINSPKELSSIVKMKKVKDEVQLEYYREGNKKSVTVTIEKRKSPQVFMKKTPQVLKKKMYHSQNSVFLGVKVEELTDQLREYFDVSDGLGVLVSEVVEDSPAEEAGLKAGDVITKIEEREVRNYQDLIRGLNYFDPQDKVDVYFMRDKNDKSVSVTLAEPQNNFEKMMWIDDEDLIHDFDFHKLHDFDENEIELKLDDEDKTIEIKKEIRNQEEI